MEMFSTNNVRLSPQARFFLVLLSALVDAGPSPAARVGAVETPAAAAATVRLESGRLVEYTIHYDRNALRASARRGDSLFALTASGSLMRLELPAVRLVRERLDAQDITCLGQGQSEALLAGTEDGRIGRIDPETLDLSDLLKLPSTPTWVGWSGVVGQRPAGLVAVTRKTKEVQQNGQRWVVRSSVVHDLATGKTFTTEDEATAFLLDGAGRLWLGVDRGEWGGGVTRVDLVHGTVKALKPRRPGEPGNFFWDGVYGFAALSDGQVWALGGTVHMGMGRAAITRVDEVEPRPLFSQGKSFWFLPEAERAAVPPWPVVPITHVFEERDGLLVLSYSDVFRVDKALKSWKYVATLEIEYRWGRRDAVGSYPSVGTVHPPARAGEPYILSTALDGYVFLDRVAKTSLTPPSKVLPAAGSRATGTTVEMQAIPHGLPGQLVASDFERIENTSEGIFVFDDSWRPWLLGVHGWEAVSLAPPFEPDPAAEALRVRDREPTEKESEGDWSATAVLVGPDGAVFTVSGTSLEEGTRTTARWVGGKSERIGRETSSLAIGACFVTPDSTLWNADTRLKRFQKGRWDTVAELVPANIPASPLKVVQAKGPPWFLLDSSGHCLFRLDPGAGGEAPRLASVKFQEGEKPLSVDDATAWSGGALLLATSAGLRGYDPATRHLFRVDLPEPPEHPARVVRDGLGRLWMGGAHGLWLAELGAKAPEAFDRVPMLRRNEVRDLAPDPQHPDGVIAAIGSQCVVFLRAPPAP